MIELIGQLFAFLAGFEAYFSAIATGLMQSYGGFGVLIGMFLESSIVPIPSELILVSAGYFGIDIWMVTVYGTIGSTLGAMVGYAIGKYGGRPIVDKVGPYLLVTPDKVAKAEKKFNEWGSYTILIARLIPFIPFKVFSITSGLLKYDFKQFVLWTFIGTIPRALILAWLGTKIYEYKTNAIIAIIVFCALLAIAWWASRKFRKKKTITKKNK